MSDVFAWLNDQPTWFSVMVYFPVYHFAIHACLDLWEYIRQAKKRQ